MASSPLLAHGVEWTGDAEWMSRAKEGGGVSGVVRGWCAGSCWLVLAAVGLALLVFFIADNFVLVDVRLFTFQRRMRLAWALVIAFAVGALFGAVASRRR